MEKDGPSSELCDEIRAAAVGPDFIKLVQSVRYGGERARVSLRPVEIGGERMFQEETCEGRSVKVRNFPLDGLPSALDAMLAKRGARELHLMTGKGDLHVRVTRKGHALVSRSRPLERAAAAVSHDRVKKTPLSSMDSRAFLVSTGIAAPDGTVRASMRGKYDQIDRFLQEIPAECSAPRDGRPFTVVDCGCGKAYLTFALYFHLTENLGFENVKIYGIDRREDVIATARRTASDLGLDGKVEFVLSDLACFDLPHADMTVSLHACDTATDEALAKGVEWKSKFILSAPCCQHELQKSIPAPGTAAVFAGLLRQSILRERLCDLLTDSFRAMAMRICGYRTQVVEFVSGEATARNIMIKCIYRGGAGIAGAAGDYLALKEFWRVTPWIETRLGAKFAALLEKSG